MNTLIAFNTLNQEFSTTRPSPEAPDFHLFFAQVCGTHNGKSCWFNLGNYVNHEQFLADCQHELGTTTPTFTSSYTDFYLPQQFAGLEEAINKIIITKDGINPDFWDLMLLSDEDFRLAITYMAEWGEDFEGIMKILETANSLLIANEADNICINQANEEPLRLTA